MTDKKRPDDKKPDAGQDPETARPLIAKDQTSFVDEESRTGKQFTSSRKVTDQERVGAMAPDADADADDEAEEADEADDDMGGRGRVREAATPDDDIEIGSRH